MAEFSVNPTRFDPYKNFKFRIKWDGRYVAGISKISGLRRTTEVIQHREGGDPSSSRKSPGRTEYAPVTLERGVTHDPEFENWANKVWRFGAEIAFAVNADADGIGFHIAFSNHEHGMDFHLFGALNFAVDLVGAVVNFRADLVSAQFLQNRSRVVH